jgi:phospholipid/cholesterol/gamma-HCH transport system ATP-binding protein
MMMSTYTPEVTASAPLIEVRGLKKRYSPDGPWVLKGIDLTVYANEVVAIIGTSGCGKSTLLRVIAGLETPTEGDVTLHDPNFTLVFQYSALFDFLTVAENVGFALSEPPDTEAGRHFKKQTPQHIASQVREKLKLVGLEGVEDRYPNELSGGMQKRVSFARAIMSSPRIILYDEPTSGLDPVASNTLEDYMNLLSRELKAASVVVTHTLSTICRTAQRVLLLHEGQLHWQGTPQELLTTTDPIASRFAKAAQDTTPTLPS